MTLGEKRVCVVAADVVSGFGHGIAPLWDGLLEGASAVGPVERFAVESFVSGSAVLIPGLFPSGNESLADAILAMLTGSVAAWAPKEASLYLATTVGEVDRLQKTLEDGSADALAGSNTVFLENVRHGLGLTASATLVSAACASSTCAVARAAAAISKGDIDCALVLALDAVTEFVFSGFSALMALSPTQARPFDRQRDGLTLGEAGAAVLLMDSRRAADEGRPVLGILEGWAMNNDAGHLTGPAADGEGLVRAVRHALQQAGIDTGDIDAVCAHGTGTVYNDAMEIAACGTLFGPCRTPVYSIKGAIGHTLGAAGLVELIVVLESMRKGIVPPTPMLEVSDPEAAGMVSRESVIKPLGRCLTTNSGFGGINAALVVCGGEGETA